jgi:hypothetical protein
LKPLKHQISGHCLSRQRRQCSSCYLLKSVNDRLTIIAVCQYSTLFCLPYQGLQLNLIVALAEIYYFDLLKAKRLPEFQNGHMSRNLLQLGPPFDYGFVNDSITFSLRLFLALDAIEPVAVRHVPTHFCSDHPAAASHLATTP